MMPMTFLSVYCIGGWNGQYGMKQCDVYDPVLGKWTPIAPLNFGDKLYFPVHFDGSF